MGFPPAGTQDGDYLLPPPKRMGNHLSGNVTGPVVQAGVIQNLTVNYRTDPEPTRGSQAGEAPTLGALGAKVPRTREALAEARESSPNAWEYLLYAGELYVGLKALEAKRLDYSLGHRTNGREFPDDAEAAAYLATAFHEGQHVASDVMRWISQDAQEKAFRPPGAAYIKGRLDARSADLSAHSPAGYCGIGGTGVKLSTPFETNWGASCPTGLTPTEE